MTTLGATEWLTLCDVRDHGRRGLPQTGQFFEQELMDSLVASGYVTHYRDRYFITLKGREKLKS